MIGIILYNMLGFSLPGNMAGSLQNPKRNFPLSMLISIILIIANYILPVLIVAAVPLPSLQGVPRWSEWQLGYFSLAADKVYSLFLFPLPCF
jgi:amino acid transporter